MEKKGNKNKPKRQFDSFVWTYTYVTLILWRTIKIKMFKTISIFLYLIN